MTYTTKYAEEWGIGYGANGTGKRPRVYGFYVVDQRGKRVHSFSTESKKQIEKVRKQAEDWAAKLNADRLKNWDLPAICTEVATGAISARYAAKMLNITIDDLSGIMVAHGHEELGL